MSNYFRGAIKRIRRLYYKVSLAIDWIIRASWRWGNQRTLGVLRSQRGLQQGSMLSPALFNIFLQAIIDKVSRRLSLAGGTAGLTIVVTPGDDASGPQVAFAWSALYAECPVPTTLADSTRCHAVAGRTARCHYKFRHNGIVHAVTVVQHGFLV